LVLVPQHPILEMVSQKLFCHLIKGEKNEIKAKQSKAKQTKHNKLNIIKCPNFKCSTVSVSSSACRCSSVVVSSQEERKEKSLETVL
jgi:hypothetical protein